jgi:uncharacterized membrane-anchored protein YjiN (DUF445 family)
VTVDRDAELAAAKRRALALLAGAAALFTATLFMPANLAVQAVRACAEAAVVGGLADWFAIVALFRRIPTGIPFITNHTAILPANKDRIAENLAVFVKEQFLDVDSLVALIRKHDPAGRAAAWLSDPRQADRLGAHAVSLVGAALRVIDEEHVRRLIADAARHAIGAVDFSRAAAAILRSATQDGRHQVLLDTALQALLDRIRTPDSRKLIADAIVQWLKAEHWILEKGLPSERLGKKGAEMISAALAQMLERIHADPRHELREKFDLAVADLLVRLEADPAFAAKGEQLKQYVLEDPALHAFIAGHWDVLRAWLLADLQSPQSAWHRNVRESSLWLGARLADDPALRDALNVSLENAVRNAAPEFAQFLATHIRDTVRRWEPDEMVRQIERNIGKDLQAIRINGTIVGGAVGLLLFAVSHLVSRFAA